MRSSHLRIGAKVPNSGRLPIELGIPSMARTLEDAGFDSLWVSDHVAMPETIRSRYPFAADGRATWPPDTPWLDPIVALALIAAATRRAALGTAVLVLPLRNPVILAKQAASLDVVSGGRLELGVGAGWLREEFEALGVPFERRGERLDEWIAIARACWTGRPPARPSDLHPLPEGTLVLPRPAHPIPVLIGGHSRAALRRAGAIGDGWLAQQSVADPDPSAIARAIREAGRDDLRVVLRLVDSAGRSDEVARRLPEFAAAGVDEVIVDVDWNGDPQGDHDRIRDAALVP